MSIREKRTPRIGGDGVDSAAQMSLDGAALHMPGPLAILGLLRLLLMFVFASTGWAEAGEISIRVDEGGRCQLHLIHPTLNRTPRVLFDGREVDSKTEKQGNSTVQSIDVTCGRGDHVLALAEGEEQIQHVPFVLTGDAGGRRAVGYFVPTNLSEREFCLTRQELSGERALRNNLDDLDQAMVVLRPAAAVAFLWRSGWTFDFKSLSGLAKGVAGGGAWEAATKGVRLALETVNNKLTEMAKRSCPVEAYAAGGRE